MRHQYERSGESIKDLETGKTVHFSSLNQARRASRDLQTAEVKGMPGRGLGRGRLRVIGNDSKFSKKWK